MAMPPTSAKPVKKPCSCERKVMGVRRARARLRSTTSSDSVRLTAQPLCRLRYNRGGGAVRARACTASASRNGDYLEKADVSGLLVDAERSKHGCGIMSPEPRANALAGPRLDLVFDMATRGAAIASWRPRSSSATPTGRRPSPLAYCTLRSDVHHRALQLVHAARSVRERPPPPHP